MALPSLSLVPLRTLCSLVRYVPTGGRTASCWSREMRWYGTKFRNLQEHISENVHTERGEAKVDLLKEFPDPKGLLNYTISRSLGVSDLSELIQYSYTERAGIKKATVTLQWPCKIEEQGHASKRIDAERFAAAAACLKLRRMGVIGPDNQLAARKASRQRGKEALLSTLYNHEEGLELGNDHVFAPRADDRNQALPFERDTSRAHEALSMFPKPKDLLNRVLQVAMSSNSAKNLMTFRTKGRKMKECELTLHWPEEMKFNALAKNRVTAERLAAALACLRLKELELLDKNNNPLTHAMYHKEQVQEAQKRHRRPLALEIPQHLQEDIKEYLAQYPVETQVQSLWEEEEPQEQQMVNQEPEEDDLVMDAITGRPYRALSEEEAQQLSAFLQEEWEMAKPQLGVKLPVDSYRQQVISAVESSQVVVIAGETGCGKTTRIPRFLLEEQVRGGRGAECNILVTQPRRISAVSVSHRVAQEMGPALKHSVGYQVRLESCPPKQSGGVMLFLTVGVLLKKLQSNPSLKGISHVVVDEVHERDINTDLLLALLRSSLKENPNLKVVLMSATGDREKLTKYFGGCPVIEVPGFMHPVKSKYLEDVLSSMGRHLPVHNTPRTDKQKGNVGLAPNLDLVADVIEHIDKYGEPGAILCFLPGWQDIKAVQDKLADRRHFSKGSHMIFPLHSSLPVADQQAVFQRPREGRRKIVLTTNIAETSVTIDDIVHVVDSGTHKEQNYDPVTKVSCLDTVWISRSNVTQRKGRAGRCQPGYSYHLFPREQLQDMTPFPIPEILRTPLENLVMQAKVHSPNCKALDFLSQVLDSPENNAVKEAVKNLQEIGVLDETESLTHLGTHVACMSCDPRLGKVLVLGALFRCALPMMSVAASLTRDPFHNNLLNRAEVVKAKEALSGTSYCDYLVFIRAVQGWRWVQQAGNRFDINEYLHTYKLSGFSLQFINGLISQFSSNMRDSQLVSHARKCQQSESVCNENSDEDELLKAVLLAGMFPNLVQIQKGTVTKQGRFRPNSLAFRSLCGNVLLHRSSVNRKEEDFPSSWLTFFTAVKSSGVVFIRDSSLVHPLALLLFTDCDITETVCGDRVEISLSGNSLARCELPADSWELLWDLRTSIQTMIHRNLSNPDNIITNAAQDGQLIALLVNLLNNTHSILSRDSKVD